jgi:hypothetical protein
MARIRTIKPEFWIDEKVGRLKRDVRLLFIGLWNISDDQGVVKSQAAYIKGQLFSYDEELRVNTVQDWLTSLVNARMLIAFTHQGEGYYLVRTFEDHQLINRPSKPKFPTELLDDLKNTHTTLTEYSQPEGKGKEQGKERNKGSAGEVEIKNPFSEQFLKNWNEWKLYKEKEFKFRFKSGQSEQAALSELKTMAKGDESVAIAIIQQSMAKGWKGLFELKNSINGNGTQRKDHAHRPVITGTASTAGAP